MAEDQDNWTYGARIQAQLHAYAQQVLKRLDARLESRSFMIGVPDFEISSSDTLLSPINEPYSCETFAQVEETALAFARNDPEYRQVIPENYGQAVLQHKITVKAILKAVREAINNCQESFEWVTFFGNPITDFSHYNIPIVQVHKTVFESCPRLQRTLQGEKNLELSLIDAAINELLTAFYKHFSNTQTQSQFLIPDVTHILRKAAQSLMETAGWATRDEETSYLLLDACEAISTIPYEGTAGKGTIILARPDHPDIRTEIELSSPVSLTDYNAVRKLIQLGSTNYSLICTSSEITGLGRDKRPLSNFNEDKFTIHFTNQFVWELQSTGNTLMHVSFGIPSLKKQGFNRERFEQDLARRIPSVISQQVRKLSDLASTVANLNHGTILVIAANAKLEAERLKKQATPIKPHQLTEENLTWLTSIDGAVLSDLDGQCYAVGVILDGMASKNCTPTRGSRYNSAVRYVDSVSESVAIVKSEDGHVNFLPLLRPLLSKELLRARIEAFTLLCNRNDVPANRFVSQMNWFVNHSFYLSDSTCEIINSHRIIAEEKLELNGKRVGAYMSFDDLTPDPEMNATYFTP